MNSQNKNSVSISEPLYLWKRFFSPRYIFSKIKKYGLWKLFMMSVSLIHKRILYLQPVRKMNIGGGPSFYAPGWINLDEVRSPLNRKPFIFSSSCRFPVRDGSMKLVYTSHVLEHLDPPTVNQVLSEVRRVLKSNEYFLIKLPDFDQNLACWKAGDPSFMARDWDFQSIVHTWPHRGVCDTLDTRTAFLFCGFWNEAYGDHFSRRISDSQTAYHGPAVMPVEAMRRMLASSSPSQISAGFRKWILERETGGTRFNHQNAWSRDELRRLLDENGFDVISFEGERIMKLFSDVPGIESMAEISMYCLGHKKDAFPTP
jgi:predicted SAM-dependent methyltransferase